MNPQQVWKLVGAILLVFGLQLYGQRPASGAATYTTFDPLGSTGTQPQGINPAGAITGYYYDATGVAHGLVRAPTGPSPRSIPRATQTTPCTSTFLATRYPSTRRGRSPDPTLTQTGLLTAS
jgi:hypothetical protein